MHYKDYKVAILGFGIEGQDATRYFLGQKSVITVFDQKFQDQLPIQEWQDKPITWVCGDGYLENGLKSFDVIVRSPGVYRYLPEIVEAEKQGSRITSNTILFFEESEAKIIGITGTKGKGTTAQMLQLGLENSGKSTLLLGNVGTPMLDRINDADNFDWVILELSSFQLIDLSCSPPVAVVTNITTDHLNWHKDRSEYIHAKENLWKHQKSLGHIVFNQDDQTCVELAERAPGQISWFSTKAEADAYSKDRVICLDGQQVGVTEDLKVPGQHNIANALAALAAGAAAGGKAELVWKGICLYEGAEHRLETVGKLSGVTYINDSAATTPEAAMAALQSFKQPKILIAGGSLKGVNFDEFAKAVIKENVRGVFLIGEAAKKIQIQLEKERYAGGVITGLEDVGEIVSKARSMAKLGDVVLLSPACASFGLFRDYKDRGEQFKGAVRRLQAR